MVSGSVYVILPTFLDIQPLSFRNMFRHRVNYRVTSLAARDAVTSWYDEIKDYNYNKATFGMNTGR